MSSGSDIEDAITLGKSWIASCLQNHKSCGKKARHANIFCSDNAHYITDLSGDGLVPSRLLAFSRAVAPGSDEDIVKLVLSTELDAHTQYVALSHRWGSLESVLPRTLKSNFKRHVDTGLQYNELPRTFRDAIDITRGMGYNFLWIDSLCIIQGSKKDWQKEARRMAIIYDNAIFTIAAMDADDSTHGLYPVDGGCVGGLESRAWACQERMISPRTMMFTNGSVAWECRQATASSTSPIFVEEDDGSVVGCDKADWVPPTRPKAIFAFFRDWRLPPVQEDDTFKYDKTSSSDENDSDIVEEHLASSVNSADIGQEQDSLDTVDINKSEHVDDVDTAAHAVSTLAISAEESPSPEQNMKLVVEDYRDTSHDDLSVNPVGSDSFAEGKLPDFTWSDDDPPCKVWNVPPPEGESGVFVDHENGVILVCYGSDLPAHATNLLTQKEFPVLGRSWKMHPDEPMEDGTDPFGDFMVVVRDLTRPQHVYEPFIRVWWRFLALYTPRNLTFDSDAFLAMNGITSVAQRWTHIRNTFGIWFAFPQYELCWHIDPSSVLAVRPRKPEWILPSWTWGSTRGGLVRNLAWERLDWQGNLMIKPAIGSSTGTAFDTPLPFPAWRNSRYHALEMKGNLRRAKIKLVARTAGDSIFELRVEPKGRCSDHEVYTFYPDCPEEFPLDRELDVWTFLIWHYYYRDEHASERKQCLDVHLVLVTLKKDDWIEHYGSDTMEIEHAKDERTMRRLGLIEMTYPESQMRDDDAIYAESWWKFVRLV